MNRFHSYHPSKILVVKRGKGSAVSSSTLKDSLESAGHKVKAVDSPTGLAKTLAEGKYDAVLVDPADAQAVGDQVKSSVSNSMLVRVLTEPTAGELAASQNYRHITTPEKATTVMKTLDKFLGEHKAARQLGR